MFVCVWKERRDHRNLEIAVKSLYYFQLLKKSHHSKSLLLCAIIAKKQYDL